jgi:cytochrome c biogenesis protein ResB
VDRRRDTRLRDLRDERCDPGIARQRDVPEQRRNTTLQISHDATVPWVLAAAILIVLGLLPALYISRRKVWVRARPEGTGSSVQVGGFALQRKDRFDEEFASLVEAVTTAAGGAITPGSQPESRPESQPESQEVSP